MSRQHTLVVKSAYPVAPDELFAWHARPGALERLTPPWERVRVLGDGYELREGSEVVLETRTGPLRLRWVARHGPVRAGQSFEDEQLRGPFASWHHRHLFEARPGGSTLEDRVRYSLPLGPLGNLAAPLVRPRLERLFRYRHEVLARDLARHERTRGSSPMKIAITGASGLVGSSLVPFLTTGGHSVARLVRRAPSGSGEIGWDPARGSIDAGALEGLDAVVHLAGDGIADGRWNAEKKRRIRDSRVDGTRLVAGALAGLERKPSVLVCASAIGYYGDRGSELLDERSQRGSLFLSEICEEWERAADAAREAGIRVVHMRLGIVLSPAGGALAKMLTPFKLGVGGKLGSGRQIMSWIAIDDVVGAFHRALTGADLSGPINTVAPNPVSNAVFTKTLGRVLGRPTIAPMPAFAARLAFGQMADELLLASTRVEPRALLEDGFTFDHPELEGALRHVLGKPSA